MSDLSAVRQLARTISFAILLFLVLIAVACDQSTGDKASHASAQSQASTPAPDSPGLSFSADVGPPPKFNGDRAMQYVKETVAFGPRPIGSANHKKVEEYLLAHLKAATVENDTFTVDTPEGKLPVNNIVAKFPGAKDGIIVIASHYDTNYPLRNTSYVGANDGASSTAVLLEIANQLRGKPNDGYSIWLVWDDAEEAIKPDGTGGLPMEMPFMQDSLYGIMHLAEKWQADGTLKKIKVFLLADMIGDSELNIERDSNSTPWLEDTVYEAATARLSVPLLRPHAVSRRRSCPFC